MNYLLAIDGGGTKTQVWSADDQGQVVGEGQSGPASLVVSTSQMALENVRLAIHQALATLPAGTEIKKAYMGLAGVDIPVEVAQAHEIFAPLFEGFKISQFTIVNDVEIALASGTSSANGLALISGTGSNCFGKNAQGLTAKTSGLDYLLADQGSGYSLGLATLQAAVKGFDGRSLKTELESLICQHFQVTSVPELKLKVYHPPLTKAQVAELAKLTEIALNHGDQVARHLFDAFILELVAMVSAVMTRLNLLELDTECVAVGGMMRVPYVQEQLDQKLRTCFPRLSLVKPHKPPVAGALRLALEI